MPAIRTSGTLSAEGQRKSPVLKLKPKTSNNEWPAGLVKAQDEDSQSEIADDRDGKNAPCNTKPLSVQLVQVIDSPIIYYPKSETERKLYRTVDGKVERRLIPHAKALTLVAVESDGSSVGCVRPHTPSSRRKSVHV